MKTKSGKTRVPSPEASRAGASKSVSSRTPFELKQILVPTDFSPASESALRYAAFLARQSGAKITLIYVLEPIPYPYDFGAAFPLVAETDDLMADAKTRLGIAAKSNGLEPSMLNAPIVRTGQPFQEICSAAQELKMDLVVIATHGYTGLKHVVLGSTAERVVRHAPCPVLVVREPEEG
jgi:nucleotide-binding universal stress UspA family protein